MVHNITKTIQHLQTPVEVNLTNETNSTNTTAPAPAPTSAATSASTTAHNHSNASNGTNKTNKSRGLKKRKLPEPYAGANNEEDDAPENQ